MSTIQNYNKRLESMRSERSTFMDQYRDLSTYILAHRGRFIFSEENKGYKKYARQYNPSARLNIRTLASGMMSGITSPARPWFRLGAPEGLEEEPGVPQWLYFVERLMYRVFAASNTYNSLHTLYSELAVFATAPLGIFPDFENVIRTKSYTVGSYYLGAGPNGMVDSLYREFEMPAGALVKEFGYENCSRRTKKLWDKGGTEEFVRVVHVVEPNDDRDMGSPLAEDKAFRSVYYELGQLGQQVGDQFLKKSGFDRFPIACPRWDVAGEDIYGTDCPGMIALGDCKALQLTEKRKYQAIDKVTNPLLIGSPSIVTQHKNAGVNDILAVTNPNERLDSVYGTWRPDLNAIYNDQREIEARISKAFYADLFLMLASTDRREITAREVSERHEEKLLMLGPMLERLHSELLDPLINITFERLVNAGVIPPAPEALQNTELSVEYISVLAQAQRMSSVNGIERVVGFASSVAQIWPEASM